MELFRPHRRMEADQGKALRVSRYLAVDDGERHVRVSVWNRDGVAQAAVSIDEDEAARLGRFLLDTAPTCDEPTRRSLLHGLLRGL